MLHVAEPEVSLSLHRRFRAFAGLLVGSPAVPGTVIVFERHVFQVPPELTFSPSNRSRSAVLARAHD